MTSAWLSSYNQSKVIRQYGSAIERAHPTAAEQLAAARRYNEALSAGVVLGSNTNVPVGNGSSSDESLRYDEILTAAADGLMARIKIPKISVDLPIYHGTSDEVLLRGAGHLEGSHLPVGGIGAHSVITAHRGLASATMFSDLDGVDVGDRFTIEVFGEVLSYEVRTKRVIDPAETDTLRADADRDLVTLITCTPLGINSHRIVVTGERVTPTPVEDVRAAGAVPAIPGFPWWAVLGGTGVLLLGVYVTRRGFVDARQSSRRCSDPALPGPAGPEPAAIPCGSPARSPLRAR